MGPTSTTLLSVPVSIDATWRLREVTRIEPLRADGKKSGDKGSFVAESTPAVIFCAEELQANTSGLSALSSTKTHLPFASSINQACTSCTISALGSSHPFIPVFLAISRYPSLSLSRVSACTQNTCVVGESSRIR